LAAESLDDAVFDGVELIDATVPLFAALGDGRHVQLPRLASGPQSH